MLCKFSVGNGTGGWSTMMLKGDDLLYSETSPRGEVLLYSRSSGGRSAMGDDPLYDTGNENMKQWLAGCLYWGFTSL